MENSTKTHSQNSHENGKVVVGKDEALAIGLKLVSAGTLPMSLYNAVKLDLFEIIGKAGPGKKLSAAQIASQLPTKNPDAASMLDRILFLLSNYAALDCEVVEVADGDDHIQYERVYGLSPVGKLYVRDKSGNTLADLVKLQQDKVFTASWYELGNAILEGGIPPFDRAHGMDIFEYAGKNPKFNETFNKALAGVTNDMMNLLLEQYNGFEGLQTLVDVGGGFGISLQKITSKYPFIKGINFDLPHVVKQAPSFPGIEHVGGDMFESVPRGDAIFMKGVLHDWSDAHCLKLLKNCRKALPVHGKVIIVDFVVPVKSDPSSVALKNVCHIDVLMMTQNTGGKERSEIEFRALATGAGFSSIKIKCYPGQVGVVEMYK